MRPIAHVVVRPSLAGGLLVPADGQHDHVRLRRHLHRFRDQLCVILGITRRDRVLLPRAPHGDLAALRIGDLDPVAHFRPDASQHRGVERGLAAIAAQQHAVTVRPNDRKGANLLRIQRREAAIVLEQRDGLSRRLQSDGAIRLAAHHPLRLVRIHIRVLEQPHPELPQQHGRDQFVEFGLLQHAFAHQFGEVQVTVRLREFDVDAGLDGERARFLLVGSDKMPVRVGTVTQFPDGVVVGDHEALETPLLPQHVPQQPLAGVRRHTVYFVVACHHADRARLPDALLERLQKGLAQDTQGDVDGGAIHSRLGLAVGGEVF